MAGGIDGGHRAGRAGDCVCSEVDDEAVLGEEPGGVAHRRALGGELEPLGLQGVTGGSVGIGGVTEHLGLVLFFCYRGQQVNGSISIGDAAVDLLAPVAEEEDKPEVLGDSAYADGATRDTLETKGFKLTAKCPPVRNATGLFTKDRFVVDLGTNTVTCPAGPVATINPTRHGGGRASFKAHCPTCPLRAACTKSRSGRTITVH